MKQFLVLALAMFLIVAARAQTDTTASKSLKPAPPAPPTASTTTTGKKDWSKIDLSHRANDHFVVQIGYDNWLNKPDTLHTVGISRSFNFYFMYDFPFKTDPRLSVGAGIGIGSSNIFFSNQASPISPLPRTDAEGGDHFKKYKIVTTFLEIPLELRYALDPENTNKSWKFGAGIKIGTMLSAYAKGKNIENSAGQVTDNVTEKISGKAYFNNIKLAGTLRVSKGMFGIFGQVSATSLIKSSYSTSVNPFSVGINLSGL